jgi:hypothetical protein
MVVYNQEDIRDAALEYDTSYFSKIKPYLKRKNAIPLAIISTGFFLVIVSVVSILAST